jgi:predicted nucleic acid-binding protein
MGRSHHHACPANLRTNAGRVALLRHQSAHRDDLEEELNALCELAPVPKTAWRWVETAQYKLTQKGQHRSAGPLDLLLCATAIHHGLTVLHVDNDFKTLAAVLPELRQRDIRLP